MTALKDFKVNNFDLLRLLAAIQVVFDHYFQHLNISLTQAQQAWLYLLPGVPVFFVISGYLISASYERNDNLVIYLKNRILRIFPGLWACIILTVIVFTITGTSFLNRQTLSWLPAQFLGIIYTPSFLADYGFGSYNGSLWTIPIELGTAAQQGDGQKPFFRHTATYETIKQTVSFAQRVSYQGRPLWQCPGIGVVKMDEEENHG